MPKFTWNIDPILVHIGPLAIRYYSLLFVFVFLGGYSLLKWQIERGGGDEEDAGDFIVYGVLGVLVGSRLGHVLFYDLDKALKDPLWVFRIWEGGLASHGAVLGLIFAMYLFTKRRHVPFLEGADRFSFSAALGATLVRVGNFFNSEIVGRVTDQSWGVRFPRYDRGVGEVPYRHPSQLYEVALGLFVLLCLWLFDKKLGKEKRPRGALISLFFALYFPGRFVVEYFKEYQTLPTSSALTMGQYLSIPAALLGFYGLYWAFKRKLPVGWVRPEYDDEDYDDEDYDDEDEDDDNYDPDVEEEFAKPEKVSKKSKKPAKKAKKAPPPEDDEDEDEDEEDDDDEPPKKSKKATPSEDEDDEDDESPEPPPVEKKSTKKKKVEPEPDDDDD
ncbi:MAG: prolipoprotein diacylglyceryl transferase [Myxococcales bacterium]|nr:prolipoprotein diacylglyceryl transferase [Myxococcales bacterium]MCB9579313.1 prolipoprotein diacylglyceryl transferase [Polyangiaceae bacterium]